MPTDLPQQVPPTPWFNDLRKLGFVLTVIVAITGAGRAIYTAVQSNESDKIQLGERISEVDRRTSEHIQETLNILKSVQQKGEENSAQIAANQTAAMARVDKYAPILALQTQATAVQDTRLSNIAILVGELTKTVTTLVNYAHDTHEDVAVIKAQRPYTGPISRNN